MTFKVEYHEKVVKEDIKSLSRSVCLTIKGAIEKKLMSQPEVFGKPLRRSLKSFRKLRVGDYRVVFRLSGKVVRILAIKHRSEVYQKAEDRVWEKK